MIGQTIDRYHVLEKLGQGGMGVVYKARDTLLGRLVALKALPPDSASDSERRQRFLEEARAASALQHPGIVSVYDVVQADGQDFIVMELVAGETLDQRMGQRALPLTRALRYAEQIADALARAHAAGIVHRDLKPSNVMVTEDDTVKVLDFGLAKLTEAPFPGDDDETVSRAHRTREGAIAGTLAYMSPEQAAGKPVDARTDVFSFGVLLYEMLTGRHPFRRGSQLETLSAIREADPERPTQVAPGLAPEAERAILRCLHKDSSRRWQSMADLSAVLRDLREDSESARTKGFPAGGPARRHRAWPWLAAAAAVAAAAGAAYWLFHRAPAPAAPLELTRLTYDTGLTTDPSISADGKLVAYASDRSGEGHMDIWVQLANQPQPARLTRHPADDWQPCISPDGSRVAFRSERDGGGIYVVGALGGEERKIADRGIFPRFSPDGSQVVYLEDAAFAPRGLKMFLVQAEGGSPRPFQPDFRVWPFPGSVGPLWSPDGRFLLFAGAKVQGQGRADWWVAPLEGGPAVSTGASSLPRVGSVQIPIAWVGGHLLVAGGTTMEGVNVHRVRISPGQWKVGGPLEPLTSGTGISHRASVAADGRMAIARFNWLVQLWEIDARAGAVLPATPPRALTHDAAPKNGLSLARGAARVAYSAYAGSGRQYRTQVRLRDLASGKETTPIQSVTRTITLNPHLSADGALVSWEDQVQDHWAAFVGRSGDSTGREVCRDCTLFGFFSDSRHVLSTGGPRRLVRRSVESGAETPLLEMETGTILDANVSWDDRWLAAAIGQADGAVTLSIVPVGERAAPPTEGIPVARSLRVLSSPRWSPEGDRLYYVADQDDFVCIWAQALDAATKRPRGEPAAVFHAHRSPCRMNFPRGYSFSVGRDRIVFSAGELVGNVLMGQLPPE